MKRRNFQFLFIVFILLVIALVNSSRVSIPRADEAEGKLKVSFMDVGQGDAILLTTPNKKHILIDGGPDTSVLTRLGQEIPFNQHSIDLAIVSHNHSDHITGLNSVIQRYDVKQLWISGAIHTTNEYLRLLDTVGQRHTPTEVVYKGKVTEVDGIRLEVLHPIESMQGKRPDDQHDATLVVKATYGAKSFLLTGDIDEKHEQAVIKSYANEDEVKTTLKSDVLKVPHHGSASGLALNFLNFINPQYAVIQSGKDNKYGHPAPSILSKLEDRSIQVFRNDEQGTIWAITDGSELFVKAQRQ